MKMIIQDFFENLNKGFILKNNIILHYNINYKIVIFISLFTVKEWI